MLSSERMAQHFSRDFCDWYEQECTMITMDSVSMEMCWKMRGNKWMGTA